MKEINIYLRRVIKVEFGPAKKKGGDFMKELKKIQKKTKIKKGIVNI